MLTTTSNETLAPHHDRMPFLLRPDQFDEWLGEQWETVLANPDKAPLEKVIKQPELF
jgi:putative SOS response-associated peptidase YedK